MRLPGAENPLPSPPPQGGRESPLSGDGGCWSRRTEAGCTAAGCLRLRFVPQLRKRAAGGHAEPTKVRMAFAPNRPRSALEPQEAGRVHVLNIVFPALQPVGHERPRGIIEDGDD